MKMQIKIMPEGVRNKKRYIVRHTCNMTSKNKCFKSIEAALKYASQVNEMVENVPPEIKQWITKNDHVFQYHMGFMEFC